MSECSHTSDAVFLPNWHLLSVQHCVLGQCLCGCHPLTFPFALILDFRPNMCFDVDLTKLERQYKLLQWHLHPDKVMGKTSEEREFAAQQATLINHAYSVLRAPLSRANYIVSTYIRVHAYMHGQASKFRMLTSSHHVSTRLGASRLLGLFFVPPFQGHAVTRHVRPWRCFHYFSEHACALSGPIVTVGGGGCIAAHPEGY